MLQFLSAFLPLAALIAAVFAAVLKTGYSGRSMARLLYEFDLCVANSPAQVAFFMFSITAAIASGIISGAFAQVSTAWILTLDILFTLSSMLLVLFHRFKMFPSASL
ncbi:MAG TPA: hypothetical protein VHT96_02920 [Clostridia bacterium]|nr:hypothetical protein [Clostridia bacterium]